MNDSKYSKTHGKCNDDCKYELVFMFLPIKNFTLI